MAVLALVVLPLLGVALGLAVGWLWGGARARARGDRALLEAEKARVAAEAQAGELRRAAAERASLLDAAEQKLSDTFRALAAQALAANNEGFLTLAAERMSASRQESDGALAARQQAIEAMVKPVKESLDKVEGTIQELERERGQAYGRLSEQVRHLTATHERLSAETGSLARALRAPAVRGRWGELQLKRVVELAGMVEHCDFGQQVTLATDDGRVRPDMVVNLAGGRQVVVDAKVPLEAYLDALEVTDETERQARLKVHAQQVRAHVHKLSGKAYWAELASAPDFVVMFLPSEAMYAAALEQMPSLIEEGVARRVLLATPTTLIALLQSVYFGWREERLAENAQQISEQGRVLHERVATLVEHWARLGAALNKATEHFNQAAGSFSDRVLPAARKLQELGAGSKKDVAALDRIDVRPRPLTAVPPAGEVSPVRAQLTLTHSS